MFVNKVKHENLLCTYVKQHYLHHETKAYTMFI